MSIVWNRPPEWEPPVHASKELMVSGSTLVGILCAGCERPILEHDQVECGATVYHVDCLPERER